MFSKWLPLEAAILKLSLKFKIMKLNLFLKNMAYAYTFDNNNLCLLCK